MNMRKKLFFILIIVFLSFFIFINKKTQACDYIPTGIIIYAEINKDLITENKNCLDENCFYILKISKNDWGFDNYIISKTEVELNNQLLEIEFATVDINNNIIEINQYYDLIFSKNEKDNEDLLEVLDNLIINNISDIKEIFFKEIELWRCNKNKAFNSSLYFKPYSKNEEDKYVAINNQLLNCRYIDYKRVGNWLISYYKIPNYCYFVSSTSISCPELNISLLRLFLFSLININKTTLPFLISFLAIFVFITFLFIYLIKKKDLIFFLKPRLAKVLAIVIFYIIVYLISPFTFLIYLSFFNPIYGLYLFIIIYFITSLIDYIFKKNIKKNK